MNIRLCIDSILDSERVRILVSTDGKRETPFVVTKTNLARLLRKKAIPRDAESKVYEVEDIEGKTMAYLKKIDISKGPSVQTIKAFVGAERKFSLLPELPEKDRYTEIKSLVKAPRLKKPKNITSSQKKRTRDLHKMIGKHTGGRGR